MHGALLRGRDWARIGEGIMRVRGGKRESAEAAKAHLVRKGHCSLAAAIVSCGCVIRA